MFLWTEDSCVCPKIYSGVEYVVMCYEDIVNGRLLLQENCIVEEWSANDWQRLVKVRTLPVHPSTHCILLVVWSLALRSLTGSMKQKSLEVAW